MKINDEMIGFILEDLESKAINRLHAQNKIGILFEQEVKVLNKRFRKRLRWMAVLLLFCILLIRVLYS